MPDLTNSNLFKATTGLLSEVGADEEYVFQLEKDLLQRNLDAFIDVERAIGTPRSLRSGASALSVRTRIEQGASTWLRAAEDWLRVLPSDEIGGENWWELGGLIKLVHLKEQFPPVDPASWSWCSKPLFEAAKLRPRVLLPMLTYLLAEEGRNAERRTFSLDVDFLEKWIPDSALRRQALIDVLNCPADLPLAAETIAAIDHFKNSVNSYLASAYPEDI